MHNLDRIGVSRFESHDATSPVRVTRSRAVDEQTIGLDPDCEATILAHIELEGPALVDRGASLHSPRARAGQGFDLLEIARRLCVVRGRSRFAVGSGWNYPTIEVGPRTRGGLLFERKAG